MTKEQQNLIWSSLSRDLREEIQVLFSLEDISSGKEALTRVFGEHNLTSDMESREMIYIPRNVIRSIYGENRRNICNPDTDSNYLERLKEQNTLLYTLFGEKCL